MLHSKKKGGKKKVPRNIGVCVLFDTLAPICTRYTRRVDVVKFAKLPYFSRRRFEVAKTYRYVAYIFMNFFANDAKNTRTYGRIKRYEKV